MLKTYYFVCLSFFLILTDDARGDSVYSFNLAAGGWLKLYTAPETWEEALLKCQQDAVEHAIASTSGKLPAGSVLRHVQNSLRHVTDAVLASPLNKGLAHALQLQMTQFGVSGNIFLGTHDLFYKGLFGSVEGVPLYDMDIKWGAQCTGASTGDCLTMSADGSVHYSSCTDPLPFICYKKLDSQKMNECGTYDNEYQLNKQTGSCYKIHQNQQSWANAYSTCASEGAHLVILNDAEEARIVRNLFPSLPSNGFPVGLVSWGKARSWLTIHGESIDNVYNNWDSGNPSSSSGNIRVMCLPNGELYEHGDNSCTHQFVCEKSPPR